MCERESEAQDSERLSRPWLRSDRPVPRLVVRPLERFLELESGSAALLMAAAVAALVWVNVSVSSYEDFWTTELALDLGVLELEEDLRHLVNDLLMAVFFYVVALEVKREVLFGSLRDPVPLRCRSLPRSGRWSARRPRTWRSTSMAVR